MKGREWFPPLDPSQFEPEPDTSENEGEQAPAEPTADEATDEATDEDELAEQVEVPGPQSPVEDPASPVENESSSDDDADLEPVGTVARPALTPVPVSGPSDQPDWASEWVADSADEEDAATASVSAAPVHTSVSLTPAPAVDQRERAPRSRLAVGGAVVAILALAGAGVAVVISSASADSPAASIEVPGTTTPTAAATTTAAEWCPPTPNGDAVRGNGVGGTGSGPDAIFAFDYAFYTDRSGAKAREVVAPDARVSSAEQIQAGIDTIPVGTVHCLSIRPTTPATFAVELTEKRPDGQIKTHLQTVVTEVRDGRTLITSIAAAG